MNNIIGKGERLYFDRISKHIDQGIHARSDSPQEGFEYFQSEEYLLNYNTNKPSLLERFTTGGIKSFFKMTSIYVKHISKVMKARSQCFFDIQPYLDELDEKGYIENSSKELIPTFPNQSIWEDLTRYANENWGLSIGFTELPQELVFKGKAVLFRYVIVCYQEMQADKINQAPNLEAGREVMKVYKELGFAVDDIAKWLRKKYKIKCQSNHPLGGLVNITPLAAKAGLGWQGHNGLLITPEYGQRQRIAPIFIQEKLFDFTDNDKYRWIERFCMTCRKCEKACPAGAIYAEKITAINNVPGINSTRTCIDRTKCYPQFNKTLGCSICVKVCPFSKGRTQYNKIKQIYEKRL